MTSMTELTLTFETLEQTEYKAVENLIKIDAILDGKNVIKLRKPIRAAYSIEGKYHFIDFDKLNLHCYGKNYAEAIEDFNESFMENSRYLSALPDNKLSFGAKRLKSLFEDYASI